MQQDQVSQGAQAQVSQGVSSGVGLRQRRTDGWQRLKRKRRKKKLVVWGVVLLVVLIGVPLLALNVGRFRGDIRHSADEGVVCSTDSVVGCEGKPVGYIDDSSGKECQPGEDIEVGEDMKIVCELVEAE